MSDTTTDDEVRLDALERDLQRYRLSRDTWTILVLAVGFIAALGKLHRHRLRDARQRRWWHERRRR